MKKLLLTLSIGVGATFGFLSNANAQETQIKFFGQPEYIYQSISTQNNPSDWVPDATSFWNPILQSATGDPNATVYKQSDTKRDTTTTNFNTGKMVLFVSSQLSDKISVISENSAYSSGGNFQFEIERLLLRYSIKDYFSVRVGRMFVPIGYWNNKYNLGLVLQPTIERPLVIRNSSEGGVLQVKDNGAQFEGDNITKLRLSYRLMLSNGLGYNGNDDKTNDNISVTAAVASEPIEGLKLLVSGRTSTMRGGAATTNGIVPDNGTQFLTNAAIAYMNSEKKPEFIAEIYNSRQVYDNIEDGNSWGYFAYAGYKLKNNFVPYARYSYSQGGTKSKGDLYYFGIDGVLANVQETILGVRYLFNANFVFKLEYVNIATNYTYQNGIFPTMNYGPLPVYSENKTGFEKSNSVRMQFAFAF